MNYSEVDEVYEVGPISVSDDREQDYTYRVEVLREIGSAEYYRLFVTNKQRYFVRRDSERSGAYRVKVSRESDETERHEFIWDKDEFAKQLEESPNEWQKKLIEAKDNTLLWENLKGPTVADVLRQFKEELLASFPSLESDMSNLKYKEVVKTVDLEVINLAETNHYYQFRVEVVRDTTAGSPYIARVYRRENYSLQPTFSLEGELAYDVANCSLWVEDEENMLGTIEGSTVDDVIEQAIKARDQLEAQLLK